jgi:putative transposase
LKKHEAGVSVADLCRHHGVSDASIYKWKVKAGGMEVSDAKRLKTLMGREHTAEATLGRHRAGQCCLDGPRGKKMATPAAKKRTAGA